MSSNWARIQQTPTVPQFVEAARDRQGRFGAEVAFKYFTVVSHGLDHALSPAIVQTHRVSNSGRDTNQISDLRVVASLHDLKVVARDPQVLGMNQQRDCR